MICAAALMAIVVSQSEPGRASIDAALDRIYQGTQKDYRFGLKPASGETESPLAEVVVYRNLKPVPHWHYVTYGLSELGAKTSSDPKLSGFGVEYTLRLFDASKDPPTWPINLLRWIAKRVRATRNPYDPGHSMDLPAGMLEEMSPGVEGLAFYEDEELRTITTPNGTVRFVNAIPLMAGELALIGSWDAFKLADEIRTVQKDLLWRRGRTSCLAGPRGPVVRALAEKEGSSQSVMFTDLACSGKEIVLDRVSRLVLERVLRFRLAFGRDLRVISSERGTQVTPGAWKLELVKDVCQLQVPPLEAGALADEIAKAKKGGVIKRAGGVRLRVEP
jgi:suppressor of fused